MIYKFVELSDVSARTLEETVNAWVGQGWQLDAIRFVTAEATARPRMAFVSFVRESDDGDGAAAAVPERSALRRRRGGGIVELGELDPGELEPFDAPDLDWANARKKPRKKKR